MLTKNKYQLAIILISMIGAIVVLISASRYGLGLSPDSIGYLSTAENITLGKGFRAYENSLFVVQPPMYPIILALPQFLLGINASQSATIVNIILFGLILYMSGLFFLQFLPPKLALPGTISLLISTPLINVTSMAWSEPLFILCTVWNFLAWRQYMERKDWISIISLALSITFATLTRYIGIVLLLSTLLALLFINRASKKHLFVFTIISILPISLWVIRNYLYTKTFFGPRTEATFSLLNNIIYVIIVIARWFIPYQGIVAILFFLTLIALIGIIYKQLSILPNIIIAIKNQQSAHILYILLYTLTYISFLTISASMFAFDRIDSRLLSPVTIPIVLFLWLIVNQLFSLNLARNKKTAILLSIGGLILLSSYNSAEQSLKIIRNSFEYGIGYANPTWLTNEVISYIKENTPTDCVMYSNGPDVVYYLTRRQFYFLPHKTNKDQFKTLSTNNFCITWLVDIKRDYLVNPEEILTFADLSDRIDFKDGTIYFFSLRK